MIITGVRHKFKNICFALFLYALLTIPKNVHANNDKGFPIGFSSHALIKAQLLKGDSLLQKELTKLVAESDCLLLLTPPSVMNDDNAPNGFDPHNYVSYAPYWWPNPNTKNGLPYIRKDGLINTELRDKGDDKAFTLMANSVRLLALAYFYTDEEKYAKKASELLSVWFLDSSTKMNPNVEGGQIILGRKEHGRRAGINEMRFLSNVIDGVKLLSNSNHWTAEKNDGIKAWFFAYFNWLNESEHGKKEKVRPNNHGTWYDVQYVSIALFLEKQEEARTAIESYAFNRIDSQIDTNGVQPLEVVRGFSLHYSLYNLQAFFALATLAESLNIDLWNYKSKKGLGMQEALDYVIPYIGNQEAWPYDDFGRGQPKKWSMLLAQAAVHYNSEKYVDALSISENVNTEQCTYCYRLIVPMKNIR